MTALRPCGRCDRGIVWGASGLLATAARCACVGRCPICDDTGLVTRAGQIRGDGPRRACDCRLLDDTVRRWVGVRVPARHATATLADTPPSPGLLAVTRWLDGGAKPPLLVTGPDRTKLLAGAGRELVSRGQVVRYVSLRALFVDRDYQRVDRVVDELVRAEWVLMDEIGPVRATWQHDVIARVLDSRHERGGGLVAAAADTRDAGLERQLGGLLTPVSGGLRVAS